MSQTWSGTGSECLPDETALAIVDMGPDPCSARRLPADPIVGREKPIPGSDVLRVVDLDLPFR